VVVALARLDRGRHRLAVRPRAGAGEQMEHAPSLGGDDRFHWADAIRLLCLLLLGRITRHQLLEDVPHLSIFETKTFVLALLLE
jgi:hypothetical protein